MNNEFEIVDVSLFFIPIHYYRIVKFFYWGHYLHIFFNLISPPFFTFCFVFSLTDDIKVSRRYVGLCNNIDK